jgi:hypothetical protein
LIDDLKDQVLSDKEPVEETKTTKGKKAEAAE